MAREVGPRLRQSRLELGMTLRDVSDASGVSLTYLSDLERGVLANPTLDTLKRLGEALGLSLNDLLGVTVRPSLPAPMHPPLQEFLDSEHFRDAIAEQSTTLGLEHDELRREWARLLGAIRIRNRAPRSSRDYLPLFELMRSVLRL